MKRSLSRLGLMLCATVVTLALCEGLLRVSGIWVGRHTDTMFTVMESDPVLGWKMRPNAEEKVSFVDVENIPVHANSLGFWDKEFQLVKNPAKTRIAFIGDSMTWGLGVKEKERFSNIIESENPTLESYNFGIPGFGSDQELLLWRNVVARFHPDVVVLTLYSNDFADNMFVVRSGLRKPYFEWHENSSLELREMSDKEPGFWSTGIFNEAAPPYSSLFAHPVEKRSRVLHWLAKHSDLARLGYTILRHGTEGEPAGVTAASAAAPETRVVAKSESQLGPTERAEVHLMRAILKQLEQEVTASGARLLVVLSGEPSTNFDVQKLNLQQDKIEYLDATTEAVGRRIPGGAKALYYPYNKHWTPAGHRAVAEMILAAIFENQANR